MVSGAKTLTPSPSELEAVEIAHADWAVPTHEPPEPGQSSLDLAVLRSPRPTYGEMVVGIGSRHGRRQGVSIASTSPPADRFDAQETDVARERASTQARNANFASAIGYHEMITASFSLQIAATSPASAPRRTGKRGELDKKVWSDAHHALASATTTTMAMSSHVMMEGSFRRVARLNGRSRQAASASWSTGGRTSDGLMPVPEVTTVHSPLSVFRKTCSPSSTLVPAGTFPGCAST